MLSLVTEYNNSRLKFDHLKLLRIKRYDEWDHVKNINDELYVLISGTFWLFGDRTAYPPEVWEQIPNNEPENLSFFLIHDKHGLMARLYNRSISNLHEFLVAFKAIAGEDLRI